MRRDQLEHAIRTACQIIQQPEVIVVGSQAILGTYDESQLPTAATMSIEVDILPIADSNDETARLADLIEGVAGELSTFEDLHGFSIDGVDLDTTVLPDGWRGRLVKVQNANTAAPDGEPRFTGLCLDKEDLCVAKLVAFREKDRNFVAALLKANLVDADLIAERLSTVPHEHATAVEQALKLADFDALDNLPGNDRLTAPRDVPTSRLSSPTAGSRTESLREPMGSRSDPLADRHVERDICSLAIAASISAKDPIGSPARHPT